MRERFEHFGLELHGEKTRLVEFGRYAAERRQKRNQGKPEIFQFLGFTFFWVSRSFAAKHGAVVSSCNAAYT